MKKCFTLSLCLFVFLLFLSLFGCQQKKEQVLESVPLSEESVAFLETLYEKEEPEVLEKTGIKENEIRDGEGPGMRECVDPISFEKTDLTRAFLYDVNTGTLYGIDYTAVGPSAELAQMAASLLEKATEKYGDPITYPELPTRLTKILDTLSDGSQGDGYEEWAASSGTVFRLKFIVTDSENASLVLHYQIKVDEIRR